MNDEKKAALEKVYAAAEDYRETQAMALRARERFIDTIVDAKAAKATQQEIADNCPIEPDNPTKHLSRQRVAQFLNERKPPVNATQAN